MQKWFDRGNKVLSIISYKESWKENGIGRRFNFWTNGALKDKSATCLDINFDIGFLHIGYTDFNFRTKI